MEQGKGVKRDQTIASGLKNCLPSNHTTDVTLSNTLTWRSLKRIDPSKIANCGLKNFRNYDIFEGKGGTFFYRKKFGKSKYDGPFRSTLVNSTIKKKRRFSMCSGSLSKVPRRMSLYHNERNLSSRKSVKKVRFELITEKKTPLKTTPHISRSLTEGKCVRSRLPRPSGTTEANRMLFEKLLTSSSKAEDTGIRLSPSTREFAKNETFESVKEINPLLKTSLPVLRCLSEGKFVNSRLPRPVVTTGAKRKLFENKSTDSLTSSTKLKNTAIALSPSTNGSNGAANGPSSLTLSSWGQKLQVSSDNVVRVKSSIDFRKGTCNEDDTGSFELFEKIANASCLDDENVRKQEKSVKMTSLFLSNEKLGTELKSLSGDRHEETRTEMVLSSSCKMSNINLPLLIAPVNITEGANEILRSLDYHQNELRQIRRKRDELLVQEEKVNKNFILEQQKFKDLMGVSPSIVSCVSLNDASDGDENKINPNQELSDKDNEDKLNTGEVMEVDAEVVNSSMNTNALIGSGSGFVPLNLSMCDRSMASLKASFPFMRTPIHEVKSSLQDKCLTVEYTPAVLRKLKDRVNESVLKLYTDFSK